MQEQRMQDEGDPAPSGEAARDQVGQPKVSQMVPDISFYTAEFQLSITSAVLSRRKPVVRLGLGAEEHSQPFLFSSATQLP